MNNKRTRLLLAPLAASALVISLAACGSDDDTSSAATTMAMPDSTDMAADDTTMTSDHMGDEMAGGEATVGDITVSDVWVREPAEGQTKSAAYGMISNNGDTDITLVGASVPFGATVETHETIMGDGGEMVMREVPDGFVIRAGDAFVLEPGGSHIMFIDIDPADFVGEIELTMIFDDGTELTVKTPVRTIAGMDDMEHMTDTTMAGG